MSDSSNPVMKSMRHLHQRYEEAGKDLNNFMRDQTRGEQPDPSQFLDALKRQSLTHTAMTAQFGLLQKPLKTVLNETK